MHFLVQGKEKARKHRRCSKTETAVTEKKISDAEGNGGWMYLPKNLKLELTLTFYGAINLS